MINGLILHYIKIVFLVLLYFYRRMNNMNIMQKVLHLQLSTVGVLIILTVSVH